MSNDQRPRRQGSDGPRPASVPSPGKRGSRGGAGRKNDQWGKDAAQRGGPKGGKGASPKPDREVRLSGPAKAAAADKAAGGGSPKPFRPPASRQDGKKQQRQADIALPVDHEVTLRRGIQKEIERLVPEPSLAKRVVIALDAGSEAVEDGDLDRALELLSWAQTNCPRSRTIRETYAIALYQSERWADALRELQAYRRISGEADQNHLVADCLRALKRPMEQIASAVDEMAGGDPERELEGRIVHAAELGERGDPRAGLELLRRKVNDDLIQRAGTEPEARYFYVRGDLAERAGDESEARTAFARVIELIGEDEAWDAPERLSDLVG